MSEEIMGGVIMLVAIVVGWSLSELTKEIMFRYRMKQSDQAFQKYLESLGK